MEEISVLRWKDHIKGFLHGFADIEMPGGYILKGVTVHKKNDRMWANPPAKSYIKEDGTEGWSRIFDFADKETYFAWSDSVIKALKIYQADEGVDEVPWEGDEQEASIPY